MVKALMVLRKIPMSGPGCQKAAQGSPGQEELRGEGIEWDS